VPSSARAGHSARWALRDHTCVMPGIDADAGSLSCSPNHLQTMTAALTCCQASRGFRDVDYDDVVWHWDVAG
jgi:hypothetical protein